MFKFCLVEDCNSWTLFDKVSVFKPIYSLYLLRNILIIAVSEERRRDLLVNYIEICRAQRCLSQTKFPPIRWKTIQVKMKQAPMKSQALVKVFWINLMFRKLFQACLYLAYRVLRWPGMSMMVCITDFWNGDWNVKTYWSVSLQCLQREENIGWLPGVGILELSSMCHGILQMKSLPFVIILEKFEEFCKPQSN